jgi:hypothetical protein
VIESDAQDVIIALNNSRPDYTREASIIEDLKIQRQTWFSWCMFRHTKREANRAAHDLAQEGFACDPNSSVEWEYEVPNCAAVSVMGDYAQNVS